MRTLEKNKVDVWYSNPSSITDEVDSDGNYTGEKIKVYSTYTKTRLMLYPFGGTVLEQIFGKDASLDMVALSNTLSFTKDTLLFLSQPVSNYDVSYDYRVNNIMHSLNTYQYGLIKRT